MSGFLASVNEYATINDMWHVFNEFLLLSYRGFPSNISKGRELPHCLAGEEMMMIRPKQRVAI